MTARRPLLATPVLAVLGGLGVVLAGALAGCGSTVTTVRHTRTFGSSMSTLDAQGRPNPLRRIDLAVAPLDVPRRFDLGAGRSLEVRSGVPWLDDADLESLAETVRACYASVEEATGRRLRRNSLFFLLPLEPATNSYAIEYEVPPEETDVFGWAAIVPFEAGERIAAEPVAPAVFQSAVTTLAHELTHEVLGELPLARDENLQAQHSTRWFDDGTAEWIGERFGRQRDPALMDLYLEAKGLGEVLEIEGVRERLYDWPAPGHFLGESEEPGPPPFEYELYGASFLVMQAWLERTTLPEILDRIEASPEPVGRDELFDILEQTTGMDPAALLAEARKRGRAYE